LEHSQLTSQTIYNAINIMPSTDANKIRQYEGIYISSRLLHENKIEVADKDKQRPILLLAGTSIPIPDRVDLMKFFLRSGLEVATIANAMGTFFDTTINPKKDRVDSLSDYLDNLRETVGVRYVDVVAQSYSAFEIIRVLLGDPHKYQSFVKSLILINPPGLNDNIGLVSHCHRFVYHHVLRGLTKSFSAVDKPQEQEYKKNEVAGIINWTYNTLKTPPRTLREVLDIIDYKIRDSIRVLYADYNYDINVFLQTDDQILPYQISLDALSDILPPRNMRVVKGGHNDVFIQESRRDELLGFLLGIRERSP